MVNALLEARTIGGAGSGTEELALGFARKCLIGLRKVQGELIRKTVCG